MRFLAPPHFSVRSSQGYGVRDSRDCNAFEKMKSVTDEHDGVVEKLGVEKRADYPYQQAPEETSGNKSKAKAGFDFQL